MINTNIEADLLSSLEIDKNESTVIDNGIKDTTYIVVENLFMKQQLDLILSETGYPIYLKGGTKSWGMFNPTLANFSRANSLGLKIIVISDGEKHDTNDPEFLFKFANIEPPIINNETIKKKLTGEINNSDLPEMFPEENIAFEEDIYGEESRVDTDTFYEELEDIELELI